MIASFLASWVLFHNTYLVGWLIAMVLSLVGVLVVARDQIFIGAAVSQASTLGIALALWVASWAMAEELVWLDSEVFLAGMAVLCSILAALLTARGGDPGQESHEAMTGWVYLTAASVSILVVSHSPHGLEEIHRLLSSSIIGATVGDVWTFGTLAAATAVGLAVMHQRLLLLAIDPAMAAAVGLRVRRWAVIHAAWLGLVIGLSIRSSGMLYTFGCLVLPGLVAKNVCREVRPMFLVAPLVAVGTAAVAFVLANYYDDPPAQMTVALLCLVLMVAWVVRRWRHAHGSV
jgi:ABC-type Mn2+/Zn2+ transport system permease subunit